MNNVEVLINKLASDLARILKISKAQSKKILIQLVEMNDDEVGVFKKSINLIRKKIIHCSNCNALIVNNEECPYESNSRDKKKLCIVSSNDVLLNLERNKIHNGLYYLLNNDVESKNYVSDLLRIKKLIKVNKISEMIIATSPSFKGEIIAVSLIEKFSSILKVTRIGVGVSFNSNLNYTDPETLKYAFQNRKERKDE